MLKKILVTSIIGIRSWWSVKGYSIYTPEKSMYNVCIYVIVKAMLVVLTDKIAASID